MYRLSGLLNKSKKNRDRAAGIGQIRNYIKISEVIKMKLCEGFTLVELTDTKIVQEKKIGETGRLRMVGNPNPPQEEHQRVIDEITAILYNARQRRLSQEEEKGA